MTRNKAGFLALLNTLIGSGVFLLPTIAAGAGGGGYLIPLFALPVLLYVFLFLNYIAGVKLPGPIKEAARLVYIIICLVLAAAALCLAVMLCQDMMLPGINPVLLLAVFSAVLFMCTASRHTVDGLNLLFFICLSVLLVMFLFCLPQGRVERLMLEVNNSAVTLAAMLPLFSGIAIVPSLSAEGTDRRSMCLAVCLACLVYALLTALCIAVLGQPAAAAEKYAALVALKSGRAMLDLRLLIASVTVNLVLLKPAVNLAGAAVFTMENFWEGKWMRAVICAAIFALALAFRGIINGIV